MAIIDIHFKDWLIRGSQWSKPSAVKKGNFLPATVKNAAGLIKTISRYFKSHLTISDDLQGLLKNLPNGKSSSYVLKNSLPRHFKTLELVSIGS